MSKAVRNAYLDAQLARPKKALKLPDWQRFIVELYKFSERDCLMAYLLFYDTTTESIKQLKLSDIDFERNTIRLAKKREPDEDLYITMPRVFMRKLDSYIKFSALRRQDSQLVFVTCHGLPVMRSRLNYSLDKVSTKLGLKRVTPYGIRATYFMLVMLNEVDENSLFFPRSTNE